MKLNTEDRELIAIAGGLVGEKKVPKGVVREVGCALITRKGRVFTGASLDLWCGIGFCAEHSAIANMVSHGEETAIRTIVAFNERGIIPPCGRCRELIRSIDKGNNSTDVIVSGKRKVKLKQILPM